MAWERPGASRDPLVRGAALARNDMIFAGPSTFKLRWRGSEGLGEDFTAESLADAQALRRDLLARNPHVVLLLEIRYENYTDDALPADHPWWRRDPKGGRLQAWKAGYSKLDFHSGALQDHVAAQCRAAVRSGVLDGCMLNAWDEDDDRLALLKKIRAAAGEDALLLAATGKELPLSAPLLNGQYLCLTHDITPQTLGNFARNLVWAQTHLRAPRLVAFALKPSEESPELLRLATALVLTHSDGYAYAPPGPADGSNDQWPAFWNKTLGPPLEPGQPRDGGSTSREFERGTAVYNPPGDPPAKLAFSAPRTSAATGRKAKEFTLAAGDGDLYLK
jgi:hypothetical protein